MILNEDIKRILCFGDSNTWGQNDDKNYGSRYGAAVRWPSLLQKHLENKAEVYEEGLGGRNTNFDYYDAVQVGKNGFNYFVPFVMSHDPFDLIIIMLGTGDLKIQYNRSAQHVADSLAEYIKFISENSPSAMVLVVSPIIIDTEAPLFDDYYHDFYDKNSAKESTKLATCIELMARKNNLGFMDAAEIVRPGRDGIHMTKQGHNTLAEVMVEKVRELLYEG